MHAMVKKNVKIKDYEGSLGVNGRKYRCSWKENIKNISKDLSMKL
jgi:hypothetical protein